MRGGEGFHLEYVVLPDGLCSHVRPVVKLPVGEVPPDDAPREGLAQLLAAWRNTRHPVKTLECSKCDL